MNRIIIILIGLRYLSVYLPLFFYSGKVITNTETYDSYAIIYYVGQFLFISFVILGLSFFTQIKELKKFIYFRAICELFETIKLLLFMLAAENFIFHNTKDHEMYIGIVFNILAVIYFTIKWKKSKI